MGKNNNSNPFSRDEAHAQRDVPPPIQKGRIIDAKPQSSNAFHTVRVQIYGDDSNFLAPVIMPMAGCSWIPEPGTDVAVAFAAKSKPWVIGSWYALDRVENGDVDIPDYEPGDIRIGNESDGYVVAQNDGSIRINSGPNKNVNINTINSAVQVRDESDLPDPTGGTILLENRPYWFDGFVTSRNSLDISNSPVFLSSHGSQGGFIHTGGSDALVGTNGGFFARDFFFSAPGGTMFNISADQSTEMLVESTTFSDAANLGNISNLGTIDGFRVPSFKGCNFEDFDGGLTFDGNAEKLFFSECPFRGVTANNVTMLTLAGTANIQIVDFTDNYVKGTQSDTEVWRVESGGEPSEVFQYRGTVHDTSINKDNILNGPNTSKDVEPYFVSDSYPLAGTAVIGEMHNDGSGSVTIGTQDTYTTLDITSTLDTAKRYEKVSDGTMKYVGSKDDISESMLNVSFYGANGDIYTFAIQKNNQSIPTQHTSSVEARGKNANVTISVNAIINVVTNDELSVQVKNESGTNDPTILSYSFSSNTV